MEKLSFNDVLALLLPGLFAMFLIQLINWAAPDVVPVLLDEVLGFFEKNEFLNTTLFLLAAIVAGAVIQRITAIIIDRKWYNPNKGLYRRTGYIFDDIRMLQQWLPFYNNDCKKILGYRYDGTDIIEGTEIIRKQKTIDMQGDYFDYVFYAMMNKEKNEEARTQQNFYFLFRNLFTVSFIAAATAIFCTAICIFRFGWQASSRLAIITILLLLFGYMICRPLGIWYRKRMVRVLFYQYYIEKTDKELKP